MQNTSIFVSFSFHLNNYSIAIFSPKSQHGNIEIKYKLIRFVIADAINNS